MAEREQRLTKIFHSAIERDGADRRAFLDGACGGDEELRREVESPIRSHEQAGSLINSPPYERSAELLNNETQWALVGRTLGQYRLVSLVGTGGMGEVYLADDTRLDRRVAIKILTANFTVDAAQVGRFQQEARAASALNHPNIITVYDINESDGTQYIATEFIEGETLRTHIATKKLSFHEALDITVQIAGALSAAHGAGVVHRDVKPENVMLRPDGYVKVLDFGIAKLTEVRRPQSPDAEAPTRALVKTGKGVVIGTAHYMSPEQARGHAVDARTDIWSLGVVLYEMVTGRLPFEGETASDCIASILKTEPQPLTEVIPDVPQRLEWIVQKALRKDADERYQKAKELLSDLRAVKQEVETGAHALSSSQKVAVRSGAQAAATITDDNSLPPTAAVVRTTSSAEYLVTEFKRHKRGVFMVLAVLVAAAAGVGLAFYNFTRALKSAQPSIFQNVTVTRITTSGNAQDANISPDGKYVVYLEMADDGNRSLVVKQIATGNTLPIVPPTKGNVLKRPAFSPDGTFVYYIFTDRTKPTALYQVPAIGGTPKRLIADVDEAYAVSPDGLSIAFVRSEAQKGSILVANADGTGERSLVTLQRSEWFSGSGPGWSPDGKTVACVVGSTPGGVSDEFRLVGIDLQSGAIRDLSPKRWPFAGRVVWMPDGTNLLLMAMDRNEEGRSQVWRVSYPAGEASRLTSDVHGYSDSSLGLTSDGRTLVTATQQTLSRIELLPANGDVSRMVRVTVGEGNQEGFHGFVWTPDGRIVFSSFEGGQFDLWIMNADGTGRQRLTSDPNLDGYPVVSPDGRYIVFLSDRPAGATSRLWRMDSDGNNLVQLTSRLDWSPHISPDSRWAVYTSWSASDELGSLWKVPVGGGEPIRLTDYPSSSPSYSPDGKWIVCQYKDDSTTPNRWRYGVIPAAGGRPVKQFDFPAFQYQYVSWTPDSRHLSYIGTPPDPSNIWHQPVKGGKPRKLTDFKTQYIYRHAWSTDGKTLALVRGRGTSDVVLMRDTSAQ